MALIPSYTYFVWHFDFGIMNLVHYSNIPVQNWCQTACIFFIWYIVLCHSESNDRLQKIKLPSQKYQCSDWIILFFYTYFHVERQFLSESVVSTALGWKLVEASENQQHYIKYSDCLFLEICNRIRGGRFLKHIMFWHIFFLLLMKTKW